ncbi:hypothetical protein Pmar_PMAR003145 [Perkinsus marinus ATCC 50983]|uniref:Uncharacterized protein n=1 Tax=Perkinsus marinus (strain ATCC 50983 / TXsc) TaxID=423536 RepID=C5L310_PERM5|nr:hypothetical protein Pmar_PMAR003145 [Perkinsus marinus ATCC 50983]EER08897.1 hypothetical protein Pmar_PMAR003145 [Perkinsus marinus ATCC 50983]|eukprot:XP_002777081.1 hypothetical protein Pmar_PMAR003145 [Perkinsus marinus ATCC 50983]
MNTHFVALGDVVIDHIPIQADVMPDHIFVSWNGLNETPLPVDDQEEDDQASSPDAPPSSEVSSEPDDNKDVQVTVPSCPVEATGHEAPVVHERPPDATNEDVELYNESDDEDEPSPEITERQLEAVRTASEQIHLHRSFQPRPSRARARCRSVSWGPPEIIETENGPIVSNGVSVDWKWTEQVGSCPPPVTPTTTNAVAITDGRRRNAPPDGNFDIGEAALSNRVDNGVESLINPAAPMPSPVGDNTDFNELLTERRSTAATTPGTATGTPSDYDGLGIYHNVIFNEAPGPNVDLLSGAMTPDGLDLLQDHEPSGLAGVSLPNLSEVFRNSIPTPRGLEDPPPECSNGGVHDGVT